jgi:hypothetical protein
MDFIDHLIFTTNTANVRNAFPTLLSDNVREAAAPGIPGSDEIPPVAPAALPALVAVTDSYPRDVRERFVGFQDSVVIDKAIQKHWFDMVNGPVRNPLGGNMFNPGNPNDRLNDPGDPPPYHLIYAYLLENTRITQIMERLIYLYQHDEVLGIAGPGNANAFQWIMNTESLFFKTLSNTSYRNITGSLRPNIDSSRRNAYYRMFGMDLAFGDANTPNTGEYPYYKAKAANQQFILLFEQFITEIWQAYINARNTSGANTTDYERIVDMARKLREMLMSRRGGLDEIMLSEYRFMNLSKEEYSSVGMLSWLYFSISYNSPLVQFLGCQANTSAERLINIGRKVGIEAHKKSQALIDMAGPMATVLRQLEFGTFEATGLNLWIRGVIESQTPLGAPPVATPQQAAALVDLLAIINNWEKATGHKIKAPEANVSGVVKVQQNGQQRAPQNGQPQPAKARPAMN